MLCLHETKAVLGRDRPFVGLCKENEDAYMVHIEIVLTNDLEYEWFECLFHFRDIGVCDNVDMKVSYRNKLLEQQRWIYPLYLPSPTCP
jgi:hypothetical protein